MGGLLLNCLAVGIGGFIGSIMRYLITALAPNTSFPWVTLAINVVGTFILAFTAALVLRGVLADSHLSLMIRVGLCGGFTTIGAFSLDTMDLINHGAILGGIGYAVLTCVLCVGAAFLGSFVARV
ncbi:MAG: CrcB family protein [Eggerthellaceae bacterium]|nr:CrcB family protein [Eggerthellaceae bacterium]